MRYQAAKVITHYFVVTQFPLPPFTLEPGRGSVGRGGTRATRHYRIVRVKREIYSFAEPLEVLHDGGSGSLYISIVMISMVRAGSHRINSNQQES